MIWWLYVSCSGEVNVQLGCSKLVAQTDIRYADLGLPRSVKKNQDDIQTGTMWGVTLEGNCGAVSRDRGQSMALGLVTLKAAQQPLSQRDDDPLLGQWGISLQCRRPGYSFLSQSFVSRRLCPIVDGCSPDRLAGNWSCWLWWPPC